MYKLVIAEKPSVARSIADTLGAVKNNSGYYEGEGYIVSWCFGHLAELSDAKTYNESYAKWNVSDLPIIPEKFSYTIHKDKMKQFNNLKMLMSRNDISEVINACDAGREGEIIFRTVYELAGCKKPVKRLWISSIEESAIKWGLDNLKPGSDYDNLYKSALCRAKADWLVGINATRFFSLLYNQTLNVGRVVSPTLAMIVKREEEIKTFKAVKYYNVELIFDGFTANSGRITDKNAAQQLKEKCHGRTASVVHVIKTEKQENAPALYDLTTLQRDANRTLGFTSQQTLDYLQSLYEKRLCTYPRTDSRYLTDEMEYKVSEIAEIAAKVTGLEINGVIYTKQVCCSKKVSDHHAIVLTSSAARCELASLPKGELAIFNLVATRILQAVSSPFKYTLYNITLECNGEPFNASMRNIKDIGWRIYEVTDRNTSCYSPTEGEVLTPKDIALKENKTAPPQRYTEDTLLAAMENIAELPEGAERKGFGTPATRAGIIEKLVLHEFVIRKKAQKHIFLEPTAIAVNLISVLPEILRSPSLTSQWEQRLTAIEQGKGDEAFITEICDMVQGLVKNYTPVPDGEKLFAAVHEIVGTCPRCGKSVYEYANGYFCENRDCEFKLWKNSKFFAAKRKQLTPELAKTLLSDKKADIKSCYSERTGKQYDAVVYLEDDGVHTDYVLEFGKR